jgi:hypothetical protein
MRRIALLLNVLLFLTAGQEVYAQTEVPRVELFAGFSYLPADGMDFPRENSNGFQFSLTGNVNRWFGIAGDFGGQYSTATDLGPGFPGVTAKTSVYEYLVGPRFSIRRDKYNLFFHGLVGGAKGNSGMQGFSDSAFTFAGGGGLDIYVDKHFSIRAIQMDYIGSFVDILENNARIGFGVVLRLGSTD